MTMGKEEASCDDNDDPVMEEQHHHRIAMVCDFFYPRLGGVEMHIWSLACNLIRLGHKVIVITHAYDCPDYEIGQEVGQEVGQENGNKRRKRRRSKRAGVRYLYNSQLKVYYCPFLPMTEQVCLPTFTASLPLLRWIFIREGIDVVHSHQATSALANEAVAYAAELGLPSVFTDHSLFGFDDLASVILNRVLKTTMSTAGTVIAVSHTCKDNFVLRAKIPPSLVHVIPNAIDPSKFTPDPTKRPHDRISIVVISRLAYRKGADLLLGILPAICHAHPQTHFIIAGDGDRRTKLHEMIQRERLQHRIELLGSIPHDHVRDVLVRGHIFLNCSLTESFCIAILEAASSGLYVVSTNVGGVPEVLPPDMIHLANPDINSLVEGLSYAITERLGGPLSPKQHSSLSPPLPPKQHSSLLPPLPPIDPYEFHERIKQMYSWQRVAKETILIYDYVKSKPQLTLLQRLHRYQSVGGIAGYIASLLGLTLHFVRKLIEWWQPRDQIDIVPDLCGPCYVQKKKI